MGKNVITKVYFCKEKELSKTKGFKVWYDRSKIERRGLHEKNIEKFR